MITLECAWCETELRLESLDATSVECADCRISVEIAPNVPASRDLAAAA